MADLYATQVVSLSLSLYITSVYFGVKVLSTKKKERKREIASLC